MNNVVIKTFRDAFCDKSGCPLAAFEVQVFSRCLYPHIRPLAWLIRCLLPGYFQKDFEIIGELGGATSPEELNRELENSFYQHRAGKGLLRGAWRVRLSRRRLRRLGVEVFK